MRTHTPILPLQISMFTDGESISLREDSRASHSAQQVNNSAPLMNAIYGRKCLESYEKLNHRSLWAKMLPELLIGTGEWYSSKCKLIWSLKGTKYKRLYFQLRASRRHMPGTAFSLLPTVTAMMPGDVDMKKLDARRATCKLSRKNGNGFGPSLNELAAKGLLPTPSATESIKAAKNSNQNSLSRMVIMKELLPTPTTSAGGANHNSMAVLKRGHGINLQGALKQLLPTPLGRDFKANHHPDSPRLNRRLKNSRGVSLPETLQREMDGHTFQLNPLFTQEMMGFPADWTVLPFLHGETNQ